MCPAVRCGSPAGAPQGRTRESLGWTVKNCMRKGGVSALLQERKPARDKFKDFAEVT